MTVDAKRPKLSGRTADPLMVMSVEKAFRVLSVFGHTHGSLSLSQIAAETELDLSAAQRFTFTLVTLGYLSKDSDTKRFELTPKALELGYKYLRNNRLIERATPYLMHLSAETEEAVNLTILDGQDIIFVSRFMSRNMLNTNVMIGSRMPAYCTAPGIAMLSRLPHDEAVAILESSDRKQVTSSTTWKMDDLLAKIQLARERGFATTFSEYFREDGSVAAAIIDTKGYPAAAINIGASLHRYSPDEVVEKFSSLVITAAQSVSDFQSF